jgi:hypothetical protein
MMAHGQLFVNCWERFAEVFSIQFSMSNQRIVSGLWLVSVARKPNYQRSSDAEHDFWGKSLDPMSRHWRS